DVGVGAEEGVAMMTVSYGKIACALVLVAGCVAGGVGLWTQRTDEKPPAAPAQPAVAAKPAPERTRTDLYGDPLPDGAIARMAAIRLRHTGLRTFALSADDRAAVSVASDGQVPEWDLASGRQTRSVALQGPYHWVGYLSADGKTVLGSDSQSKLVLWDADSGKVVTTSSPLQGNYWNHLAIAPDGKWVIAVNFFTA